MQSAENLTDIQRSIIRDYVERAHQSGVLVGAIVGADDWDVRPVLLESGRTKILRFTDPRCKAHHKSYSSLQGLWKLYGAHRRELGLISLGHSEDQFWSVRHFFSHVLADRLDEVLGEQQAMAFQMCRELASQLETIHRLGIVHGHLCAANLSWDQNTLHILDFGFLAFGNTRAQRVSLLAPECKEDSGPHSAIDAFGFATVLEELQIAVHDEQLKRLVSRLRAPVPAARPTLREAGEVLQNALMLDAATPTSTSRASTSQASTSPQVPQADGVKSGRVIVSDSPPAEISGEVSAGSFEQSMPSQEARAITPKRLVPPAPEETMVISGPLGGASTAPTMRQGSNTILGVLMVALVALAVIFYQYNLLDEWLGEGPVEEPEYEVYWSSNQRSFMEVVARAALHEGSSLAYLTIMRDALEGKERPFVNEALLRTCLHPAWEGELKQSDRELVLHLALAELVSQPPPTSAPFEKAHPGVILGMVANLDFANLPEAFALIPTKNLGVLPGSYGPAFLKLDSLNVKNMRVPEAHALAHILFASTEPKILKAYFAESTDLSKGVGLLRILIPLFAQHEKLADSLNTWLASAQHVLQVPVAWFSEEGVVDWNLIPLAARLTLAAGQAPEQQLNLEYLADLLQFPLPMTRRFAEGALAKKYQDPAVFPLLHYMATAKHSLSRGQVITLLAALRVQGETRYSFIDKWFTTSPAPQVVLELLLLHTSTTESEDAFNIAASRYLKDTEWSASLDQLKALSRHPERFARVLAYTRLDPKIKQEAQVLKAMSVVEPNQKLRQQVLKKLELAQESARTRTNEEQ